MNKSNIVLQSRILIQAFSKKPNFTAYLFQDFRVMLNSKHIKGSEQKPAESNEHKKFLKL